MLSSGDLGSPGQKEKSKGSLTCLHAKQLSCGFVCLRHQCLPTAPMGHCICWVGAGQVLHTHEKVQRLVSGTFPATFPLLSCQCCLQGAWQLEREEQGMSGRGFAYSLPIHCHPPSDSLSPEHRHILLAWSGDLIGTCHSRFPV